MRVGRLLFAAALWLLPAAAATAQEAAGGAGADEVRRAVQSYLDTTRRNAEAERPVPSEVVHPRSKVFSVAGDKLVVSDISDETRKRVGTPVRLESVAEILSVDVTGSMAVAKVRTVYPHGSLTAEEHRTLPADAPLRAEAGRPLTLTTYLSLLKIGGGWKIVSFLVSADVRGDR